MDAPIALEELFKDAVVRALGERGVRASALTEHYLVRLLTDYATHGIDETPLALKLLAAAGAGPRARRERLREVGDTSLYVSGFWSDTFARRAVDVDYYIDLGGSAYGELARTGDGWSPDPLGDVYGALAERFERFVEVLESVSRALIARTPQDIVRLYDQWRKNPTVWTARRLAALGISVQDAGGRPQ